MQYYGNSVHLSVTLVSHVQTNIDRVVPYVQGSAGTVVYGHQIWSRSSKGITVYGGPKQTWHGPNMLFLSHVAMRCAVLAMAILSVRPSDTLVRHVQAIIARVVPSLLQGL